jgi:hypothetical protein
MICFLTTAGGEGIVVQFTTGRNPSAGGWRVALMERALRAPQQCRRLRPRPRARTNQERNVDLPKGRMAGVFATTVGLIALAVNHHLIVSEGEGYLWAVVVSPVIVTLGLAGVLEPRIPRSAFERGRDLPLRFKVGAALAVLIGAAWGFYLVLAVYEFG